MPPPKVQPTGVAWLVLVKGGTNTPSHVPTGSSPQVSVEEKFNHAAPPVAYMRKLGVTRYPARARMLASQTGGRRRSPSSSRPRLGRGPLESANRLQAGNWAPARMYKRLPLTVVCSWRANPLLHVQTQTIMRSRVMARTIFATHRNDRI